MPEVQMLVSNPPTVKMLVQLYTHTHTHTPFNPNQPHLQARLGPWAASLDLGFLSFLSARFREKQGWAISLGCL